MMVTDPQPASGWCGTYSGVAASSRSALRHPLIGQLDVHLMLHHRGLVVVHSQGCPGVEGGGSVEDDPLLSGYLLLLSISPTSQSSCGGLVEGDSVVVPLDGGHGDPVVKSMAIPRSCPRQSRVQVLCVVAGGARMIHLLVVMSSLLSLPTQSSCGSLDEDDTTL